MKRWGSVLSLFLCLESSAAYRAYKLKVTFFEPTLKRNITQTVVSTLDHLQYENYHSGYGTQTVDLIDTWYCPGDTRRKEICKKPHVPSPPARDLASHPGAAYDKAKRAEIDYNRQPIIP